MLLKRPQHRKFEYQPRYYSPEKDPGEKFKHKMEAERRSHQRKRRPVFLWAALFLIIVYVYLYLSGAFR
ncbi:MAG TPA: hypothetical protein VJN65_00850 [Bacteroidota bacterium]|nr:hypothetical protein [Bacteroidota bacterium]